MVPSEYASIEQGKAFLAAFTERTRRKQEKFKTIVSPEKTTLQGYDAAYTKIQYSFKGPNGAPVPEKIELWVFPRGNHFLLLGLSMRQDERSGKRKEFDPVLKSFQLQPLPSYLAGAKPSVGDIKAPFLDERKQVPAGLEWNREIVTRRGGEMRFRVSSPGPFAVTLVTESAYKDMQKRIKRKYGKEDVLLTLDWKQPVFEKTVALKPGSYFFIIENQTPKSAEIRLECFHRRK